MVDSDYKQKADDIAKETCVDPSSQWEGFWLPDMDVSNERSESDVDEEVSWIVFID